MPIRSDTDLGRGTSVIRSMSTRDIVRCGRGTGGLGNELVPCFNFGRVLPDPEPPFLIAISGREGVSGRIPAAARSERT